MFLHLKGSGSLLQYIQYFLYLMSCLLSSYSYFAQLVGYSHFLSFLWYFSIGHYHSYIYSYYKSNHWIPGKPIDAVFPPGNVIRWRCECSSYMMVLNPSYLSPHGPFLTGITLNFKLKHLGPCCFMCSCILY